MKCPFCKQDMNDPPHDGIGGRDCPQCGQGIRWRLKARHERQRQTKKYTGRKYVQNTK